MVPDPEFPTFLLQSGPYLSQEKMACSFSNYPIRYCKYEDLGMLNPDEAPFRYVPVGSVEFTREYCRLMGLGLPKPPFLIDILKEFANRDIRLGTLGEALPHEFVKPLETKLFTGCIKKELDSAVEDRTPVMISEPVPFESEFRFYIQDYANFFEITGWSRYDELQLRNPGPDWSLVESVAQEIHNSLGPNSYSIDIGWRSDIGKYDLIELNDGWSLGYYENHDPQSGPPSRQQYADMLVSRWRQILFCNIV
jgi:ATP-grasp domain, R2K clade family 3